MDKKRIKKKQKKNQKKELKLNRKSHIIEGVLVLVLFLNQACYRRAHNPTILCLSIYKKLQLRLQQHQHQHKYIKKQKKTTKILPNQKGHNNS